MKILKFGGTSVGTPESIKRVIEIIRASWTGEPCVIVVSAFTKVTDQLIELCTLATSRADYERPLQELETRHLDTVRQLVPLNDQSTLLSRVKELCNELADLLRGLSLLGELTPHTKDCVMSFGERLSATVIGVALKGAGLPCTVLDTREYIKTDDHYGSAHVLFKETDIALQAYFSNEQTLTVATGFIGSTIEGATTTLGRGGSDYTASLIGAALHASVIEIWTDVDGVMSADPRKVSNARYVEKMTYEEAMELSYFGAKVIYYPTIIPARDQHIPLLIKNTFHPDAPGTLIGDSEGGADLPVTAITSVSPIVLIQIKGAGLIGERGMAGRAFSALGRAQVNVILISQASSQYSICFAIAAEDTETARAALAREFELEIERKRIDPLLAENSSSIIAVIGAHMRMSRGIAGRIFSAVGKRNINIRAIAQGSSELNISFVVSASDSDEAIRAIHDEFFPV